MSNPAHSGEANKKSKGRRALSLRQTQKEVVPSNWTAINAEMVISMVGMVTEAGGAVMLTRSRDGGVCGVRIYHDDVLPDTIWFTEDEAQSVLFEIYENFNGEGK